MRCSVILLALALTLGVAALPLAAAASTDTLDAPVCTGYVGVRCSDGSHFCQVYIRSSVCVHT
jgi:hypothetical protein